MNLGGQFDLTLPAPVAKVIVVLVALLALYLAVKIGHFLLKILFSMVGLLLLAGLVWWFWFKH
jgi:hypothetical protein